MLDVPPMAFTKADAAARLAVGRARCKLIVLYSTSCGPTEAKGRIIIEKYLAPTLSVAMGMTYIAQAMAMHTRMMGYAVFLRSEYHISQ